MLNRKIGLLFTNVIGNGYLFAKRGRFRKNMGFMQITSMEMQ